MHVLESQSQGYSISSCFNNTTPLWKEYYIPCKYDENTYQISWPLCFSNERGESAIKVKTRKWTAHILVSLAKTRVDDFWFHTTTWVCYFWHLNVTKLVKISNISLSVNRQNWEEEKEIPTVRWHKMVWVLLNSCTAAPGSTCTHFLLAAVQVKIKDTGDLLVLHSSLQRSLQRIGLSTWSIPGHTCGLLKPVTLQLTNGSLYGANEGRADVCCPSGEIMHMTLIQLIVYVSYA